MCQRSCSVQHAPFYLAAIYGGVTPKISEIGNTFKIKEPMVIALTGRQLGRDNQRGCGDKLDCPEGEQGYRKGRPEQFFLAQDSFHQAIF